MIDSAPARIFSIDLQIRIRPVEEADLPRLEWDRESWEMRQLFRQSYEDTLTGRRLMYLAEANGHPVARLFALIGAGNLAYADGVTRAYLYSLHVMPPFQGLGIGTQLLGTAEDEARRRGFRYTTIAVSVQNGRARRLYERLGYKALRQDHSHWSYRDPAGQEHHVREFCHLLRKTLNGSTRGEEGYERSETDSLGSV